MPADKLARLRAALALAVGPDPVVMLSDVAGLSTDEATSVLRWAGIALLRAGLADVKRLALVETCESLIGTCSE